MKKLTNKAVALAMAIFVVVSFALFYSMHAPKAEAGIIGPGTGNGPVNIMSSGAWGAGTTNTNYIYSYLFASNIVVPASVAGNTSSNLYYRFDMSAYKDLSVYFCASNAAANESNSWTWTFGANDDGSTNVATLLSWTVGVTNVTAGTNSFYITNLSSANNYLGAHKWFWVMGYSTTSGGGTPIATNWSLQLSPK